MRILVLQHARVEHPGYLRHLLTTDGHTWDAVQLDEGQALPSLDAYDALWVMGGPMDVWQEEEFPWLADEKALIRSAVIERHMPFLGLCLGHQLLAEALGGSCGKSQQSEVGVMPVELSKDGRANPFLEGLPEEFECLQWHGAEVTKVPQGVNVLARSDACSIQAMSYQNHAFSAQFHVEVEEDTVANWIGIPAYRNGLEAAFGKEGPELLQTDCMKHMNAFNQMAERLYRNWLKVATSETSTTELT